MFSSAPGPVEFSCTGIYVLRGVGNNTKYVVSQKPGLSILFPVTWSNAGRFSKSIRRGGLGGKFTIKWMIKDSATPQARRYTLLYETSVFENWPKWMYNNNAAYLQQEMVREFSGKGRNCTGQKNDDSRRYLSKLQKHEAPTKGVAVAGRSIVSLLTYL